MNSAYPQSMGSPAPATPCDLDKPRLLTESQWLEDSKKNHETGFQTQGCQSRCRQEPSSTKSYAFCHRLVNKDLVTTINQMPIKAQTVGHIYHRQNTPSRFSTLTKQRVYDKLLRTSYNTQLDASLKYGGAKQ